MSALLPLDVHWHNRTWACGGENCRLCNLVPTREVVYFAARVQIADEPSATVLLERSAAMIQELLRRSSLNWHEAMGRLTCWEETSGRSISIDRWAERTNILDDFVSIPRLAWSVARLHRAPHFPECSTTGEASRALQAYSARIQALSLSGAVEA